MADGTSVGDASPEARARGGSTELNLHAFRLYGRPLRADRRARDRSASPPTARSALAVADLALVVVDPDPDRALLAEPTLRQLEALGIPHMIFVNKIDQARGSIQGLLEALQPMSTSPLIARWIPIRDGEKITGFVDIALERAYYYRPGKPSEQKEIPADLADREALERAQMLEQLADHDDALLEQLLMDEMPDRETVFADLAKETGQGQIVPVLFGSARPACGVRRLMKALRHEAPGPAAAAERLGAGGGACAVRLQGQPWRRDGAPLLRPHLRRRAQGRPGAQEQRRRDGPDRHPVRASRARRRSSSPRPRTATSSRSPSSRASMPANGWPPARRRRRSRWRQPIRNYALAIATKDRKDDVRLSTALHKLTEEDRALHLGAGRGDARDPPQGRQ